MYICVYLPHIQTSVELIPSHRVSLSAPTPMTFDVDGYAETDGCLGWYSEDTPVRVDVTTREKRFSHWDVNGRRRDGRPLVTSISEDTAIRVVTK